MKILLVSNNISNSAHLLTQLLDFNHVLTIISDISEIYNLEDREYDTIILHIPIFGCDYLKVLQEISKQLIGAVFVLTCPSFGMCTPEEKDIAGSQFDSSDSSSRQTDFSKVIYDGDTNAVREQTAFVINSSQRSIRVRGEWRRLTKKEFELIKYLASKNNQIVDHHDLMKEVWGDAAADSVVYVTIKKLREKIELNPIAPKLIQSVKGGGYLFKLENLEMQ